MVYQSDEQKKSVPGREKLNSENIASVIPRIERCLQVLENLNVQTIGERFDPNQHVRGLENSINSIISELFGPNTPEYRLYRARLVPVVFTNDIEQVRRGYTEGITETSSKLQALLQKLRSKTGGNPYTPTVQSGPVPPVQERYDSESSLNAEASRCVLILASNGNPDYPKVENFLHKLELAPLAFEWPKQGGNIAETLGELEEAAFALVFLETDLGGYGQDALGGQAGQPRKEPSRDSIFMLGYLAGRLGEESVCALHKPGLLVPASAYGVGKVKCDERGAWQLELARLFRSGGIRFDMNKAL